jgi:4,5-dihydroxyphthalate decarboxylase
LTTTTAQQTLTTAIGGHAVYDALKDGSVKVDGVRLDFQEVTPLTAAFRRMCRTLDYDISELAIVAYFVAREYGMPFTALPAIVLAHGQHQNVVFIENAGLRTPKDLEGRRVGARGFTVTPGVWIRGIMKLEYGLDLNEVTWVVNDEEHVAQYSSHDPPNVVREIGADLNGMLERGELVAGLWANSTSHQIKPFYPDPEAAATRFYKDYGVFPVDHLVVVKDSVLKEDPRVARSLYEALKASRDEAMRKDPHAHVGSAGIVDGDPLPYGLESNRKALQMLLDMCLDQKVLHKPTTLEELFPLSLE